MLIKLYEMGLRDLVDIRIPPAFLDDGQTLLIGPPFFYFLYAALVFDVFRGQL